MYVLTYIYIYMCCYLGHIYIYILYIYIYIYIPGAPGHQRAGKHPTRSAELRPGRRRACPCSGRTGCPWRSACRPGLGDATRYYTMLCYAMLCYAMLCYAILYYTILYYTISYPNILCGAERPHVCARVCDALLRFGCSRKSRELGAQNISSPFLPQEPPTPSDVYTYVCVYTCVYTYTCIYIYIYIYIAYSHLAVLFT